MTPARWHVWEWLNAAGEPVFLGVGALNDGKHPAEAYWRDRKKIPSPLHKWLATLNEQPKRAEAVPSVALHRQDARGYFYARRKQLLEANAPLLSTRPEGTYAGGGAAKGVIAPNGDLYESVRKAADDTGISASMITRYCQGKKNGWKYND